MFKMSRKQYADMYGPTTGDRIRLGDTSLIAEVEKDYCVYGEEAKFGGKGLSGRKRLLYLYGSPWVNE